VKNQPNPFWLRFLPSSLRNKLNGRVRVLAALQNSGWLFLDKVLRALIGLLVGAWVARYLGPSEFGELTYYIAFIAIFQSVTNLGLDGIAVRDVSSRPHEANLILGTIFRLRFIAGLTCWVLSILFFYMSHGLDSKGLTILGLVGMGLIFQAADVVDLWFQGTSQSKRTVVAKAFSYLISNSLRIILILNHAPMAAFAGVIALEAAFTALALYFSYKRFPCDGQWNQNYQSAKKLLKESWPYLVSGLSIVIYMRVDQLMIKNILGESELGIYAAIIPISNIWNMIPVIICTSIAPFIAQKKVEGTKLFNRALVLVFRVFWLLSCVTIVLTWCLSSYLVEYLYGDTYLSAIPVLNIYVLTSIPVFMGVAQGLWLLNQRRSDLAIIQTFSGAVISLVGNLVLLPIWGIKGAAVTAVLAQTVSCFLVNGIFARELFMMQMGLTSKK